ncbi:SPOR domain-containing protein [Sphingomonas sp. CGMCC 1.13654]|uniref:SPOR domain-containing protein n=2 Tax=Sphingomonas chungangi TaxID=2683589 RepID=A0A838L797_9SPHN|nr:SPOR domain-containing protein [Sphingomonas chungangi]MVW54761.1 SPOR domain-containing protein [Sphingomonas chungangi]
MGGNADEDRLPWLEPVEDETAEEGVSAGRLIAGLVAALVILGCVVGGVYWLKQRVSGPVQTADGGPATIAAPAGPYKTKPAEEGGMQVKGQGDSAYAASEGADPNAKIDLSKVPEAPIAKGTPAPQPEAPKPTPAPAKPVETAKAPAPAPVRPAPTPKPAAPAPAPVQTAEAPAAGGTIQLGALPSEAAANAAWKSLSGRYGYLAALQHSVVKADVNGKTYYRLRAAAGGDASSVCSKLKVAGEACTVVK